MDIYDYCKRNGFTNVLHTSIDALAGINRKLVMLRKVNQYNKSVNNYIQIQRRAAIARNIVFIDLSDDASCVDIKAEEMEFDSSSDTSINSDDTNMM